VAIRPPKYTSQGFTLVEMLVVLIIGGIVMGIAAPSMLSLNKPLRDGSLQMKSHLSLIRSKAISSSQAYRIRPKYPTAAEYKGEKYQETPHNFIVEYAPNCQVTKYGSGLPSNTPPVPDGWKAASQFDLDLPDSIGVATNTPPAPLPALPTVDSSSVSSGTMDFTLANGTTSPPSVSVEAPLKWSICFDNRGLAYQSVKFTLRDFQANNRAAYASIEVNKIGQIEITTNDKGGKPIDADQGNPVF
jgi:prepilin-type N-terminal cleavage/methylation domain-containing protein